MMRDGEMRFRRLWRLDFTIIPIESSLLKEKKYSNNTPANEFVTAINCAIKEINTFGEQPELLKKYYYLLGRKKYNEGALEETPTSICYS